MTHILVVEDDFAFAEALELLLASEGFDVELARDGKEGLRRMHERRPDLVISDDFMPYLAGADMLRAMNDDEALRRVPRILMSASIVPGRAEGTGAAEVFEKPFLFRDLLTAVHRVVPP